MNNPWSMTAYELVEAFRAGKLTPRCALESILERIDVVNPALNAFCYRDDIRASAEADSSTKRWAAGAPQGPLDGVPISVKDLIDVAEMPTRYGSLNSSPVPVRHDAPTIANIRAAGAIILGKTTTPEYGHKGVTKSPLTGVTRNPWNIGMTPGGSSGGAGAALAAGMGPLAIGTDGGGSCRKPANYCGVLGMKPSLGRVPLRGTDGIWPLSSPGPMARSARDLALLLEVMARPLPVDPFTLGPFSAPRDASLAGLKVACSVTLAGANARPEVTSGVADWFGEFEKLGATIADDVPEIENPMPYYRTLLDSGSAFYAAHWTDAQLDNTDDTFKEGILRGRALSAVELREAFARRGELAAAMASFFERYDLLVLPCNPTTAYEIGPREPEKRPNDTWPVTVCFTAPFNITGQPAITVPCGHTKEGLPLALQIVGRYGRDDMVLCAALALEERTGLHNQIARL